MAKLIWVASGRTDGRVVLWERHADHPGGEAYVADATPVEVAETPEVLKRLGSGQLVRVNPPKAPEPKPAKVVQVEEPVAVSEPGAKKENTAK